MVLWIHSLRLSSHKIKFTDGNSVFEIYSSNYFFLGKAYCFRNGVDTNRYKRSNRIFSFHSISLSIVNRVTTIPCRLSIVRKIRVKRSSRTIAADILSRQRLNTPCLSAPFCIAIDKLLSVCGGRSRFFLTDTWIKLRSN